MMMPMTMISLIIAFSAWVAAYAIAEDTRAAQAELQRVHAKIVEEQKAIVLAEYEWSGLNEPERLQALADRFLDLETPHAARHVRFEALPLAPVHPDGALAALADEAPVEAPLGVKIRRPRAGPGAP